MNLPKVSQRDSTGPLESDVVLVKTTSGQYFTAYVRQWEGEDPQWVQCGRDGYVMENVAHWRPIVDFGN